MPASNPDARNVRYPRLFVARSNIHGLGLFAGEDIEWGRRLIEYQGQLLSAKEVKRRQRFYDSIGFTCLMEFGDGRGVDGITGGNESRFINHSAQPNIGALREDDWRIVFYSLEDIAKGEELTFNYGFDLENYKEYLCLCGSLECVGYIVAEEFFEHVRRHKWGQAERF